MYLDVVELRRFYYRTRLGQVAKNTLRDQLRWYWGDVSGLNMAGYGFVAPFLRSFKNNALRTVCMMPAQQGAFHWPSETPNHCVLVDERRWPIPTGFLDRLIVVHAIENSDRPGNVLMEICRSLSTAGRALFIVPNRTGIWARRDTTPFGQGRPYTIDQIEILLRQYSLEPIRHTAVLYYPPSNRRFWLRGAKVLESIGQKFDAQRLAGAIVIEVQKTAYASPRNRMKLTSKFSPVGALGGIGGPKPRPANDRVYVNS